MPIGYIHTYLPRYLRYIQRLTYIPDSIYLPTLPTYIASSYFRTAQQHPLQGCPKLHISGEISFATAAPDASHPYLAYMFHLQEYLPMGAVYLTLMAHPRAGLRPKNSGDNASNASNAVRKKGLIADGKLLNQYRCYPHPILSVLPWQLILTICTGQST